MYECLFFCRCRFVLFCYLQLYLEREQYYIMTTLSEHLKSCRQVVVFVMCFNVIQIKLTVILQCILNVECGLRVHYQFVAGMLVICTGYLHFCVNSVLNVVGDICK